MKTIRVSDHAHQALTRLLGEMMAQTGKPQMFSNVVEALVFHSVLMPTELIRGVDEFIEDNRQMGYTSKEKFIREAVLQKLRQNLLSQVLDISTKVDVRS